MAVEAKAGEPFASTLGEWMKEKPEGKKERLTSLCEIRQVAAAPSMDLRYQLFHRTASAVLEARRFGAMAAVMMVQSFLRDDEAWQDFSKFAELLGCKSVRGALAKTACTGEIAIFLGWVDCKTASDSVIADSVRPR